LSGLIVSGENGNDFGVLDPGGNVRRTFEPAAVTSGQRVDPFEF
jgi:hypothetical protein